MEQPIVAKHASQGGHWYTRAGEPAYTIVARDGSVRNTTLRDARKLDLLPSVTSIIACAASPGLQVWKDEQLIIACLTTARLDGESETDYLYRIKRDANEHSRIARDRGEAIHAWVQEGFEGKPLGMEAQMYYNAAKEELDRSLGLREWFCEKSFATSKYGGKKDLESMTEIVDIKTTEKDLETIQVWDNHFQQLAAYDVTGQKKCGILYINVHTAKAKLIWITDAQKKKGKACFDALLKYYYAKNGL